MATKKIDPTTKKGRREFATSANWLPFIQKKYQAGGAVTDAPSAQQFIQSKIQQDFGEEVSTRKLDQLFQGVDQALGGKQ